MHKYVVMAHAQGPEILAGEITRIVLENDGDVISLVVTPNAPPEQRFDFVGVFDIGHIDAEAASSLDNQIKDLKNQGKAEEIETILQTHP